jgi:signal transduction histidine kinase/CheY-like chemotaxis protein
MASHAGPLKRRLEARRPLLIGLGYGLAVAVTASLASSAVLFNARSVLFHDVRESLRVTTETAAALIDGDLHATLKSPEQEASPEYATAVRPLQALLRANESVRFAYSGVVDGDSVRFVLSATPAEPAAGTGRPARVHIGQAVSADPVLTRAWTEKRTVVDETPMSGAWGRGVRANAPIFAADGRVTGFVGVIVGLDRYEALLGRLDRIVALGFAAALALAMVAAFAAYRVERSRLQAQAELTAAKATAEASARSKGEFLANMSHEIRTPLHGVLGMSEALLASPHTEADRRSLEVINKSAASLLGILNDILDFSKLEAGRVELVNDPFDPREVVDDVTDLLALRADEKGLEIAVREQIRAERIPVGDAARLKQVLLNLVGNAVKFTQYGHVRIDLETVMIGRQTVAVRIGISDTGIGMPAAVQERLFEQFAQAEASTARRFGGTGLGLAISRQLMLLMGGTLSVSSAVGVGTDFTIDLTLPAAPQSRVDPPESGFSSDARVLVCSGRPLIREALAEMLFRRHLAADRCDSRDAIPARLREGAQYAFIVAEAPPDTAPDASLFADVTTAPPLVLLTSLHQPLNNSRLSALGAVAQLRRPVREDHLDKLIAELGAGRLGAGRRPEPALAASANAAGGSAPGASVSAAPASAAGLRGTRSASGKPVVLVVDDVDLNLMVARAMLGSLGVEVLSASGGKAAIEVLSQEKVALVFMDCHMPEVDGYEVTRQVRAGRGPNRESPIVALSASAFAEDRERALASGMNDFAPKPIELHGLRKVLERWVPGFADPAARPEPPTAG